MTVDSTLLRHLRRWKKKKKNLFWENEQQTWFEILKATMGNHGKRHRPQMDYERKLS